MKNLLLKEFKLCFLPVNFVFLIMCSMILIPNYPGYVSFFYLLMNCFWVFKNADLNKDLQYSLILPITKSDIVKARCISISLYEILFFALSIPFAFLNYKFFPNGNNAGVVPNFAFYGLSFILISVSRFAFFTIYYNKAEKHEKAFLISTVIFFVLYFFCEFPVWMIKKGNLQSLAFIDKFDCVSLIKQLPILITGIVIYILGWILTYKVSAKKFEQVNL